MSLLPLTKVVASKDGVSLFQRSSSEAIAGDGPSKLLLWFPTSQMNDCLKSLTLSVSSSSVSYETARSAEEELHDIPLKINTGTDSALCHLLRQLVGTAVELEVQAQAGAGTISGKLVGLERGQSRKRKEAQQEEEEKDGEEADGSRLQIALRDGSVHSLPRSSISAIRIEDPAVTTELRHLLSVLLLSRRKDSKALCVYLDGQSAAPQQQQQQRITAQYITEMPAWKAAYRLILQDGSPSTFVAYALIDNTTSEDWRAVDLALVSAQANTFVYDLYTPTWAKRPEIAVGEEESLAPPQLEDAMAQHDAAMLTPATARAPLHAPQKPERDRSHELASSPPPPPPMAAPVPPSLLSSLPSGPSLRKASQQQQQRGILDGMALQKRRAVVEEEEDSDGWSDDAEASPESAVTSPLSLSPSPSLVPSMTSAAPAPAPVPVPAGVGVGAVSRREGEGSSQAGEESESEPALPAVLVGSSDEAEASNRDTHCLIKLSQPISVKRHNAALCSFVNAPFRGRKLSVFNKRVREGNPLAVIEFINTFGLPLEPGPMAIYEKGVLSGEAMLPFLMASKEEKHHLSYAVDLKTDVDVKTEEKLRRPHRIKIQMDIQQGRPVEYSEHLLITRSRAFRTTYILSSQQPAAATELIVEHPRRVTARLAETRAPYKVLDHFYQFALTLQPAKTVKFEVVEIEDEEERVYLRDISEVTLRDLREQNFVERRAEGGFLRLARLNVQLSHYEGERERQEEHMAALREDRQRCEAVLRTVQQMQGALERQDRRVLQDEKQQLAAGATKLFKETLTKRRKDLTRFTKAQRELASKMSKRLEEWEEQIRKAQAAADALSSKLAPLREQAARLANELLRAYPLRVGQVELRDGIPFQLEIPPSEAEASAASALSLSALVTATVGRFASLTLQQQQQQQQPGDGKEQS